MFIILLFLLTVILLTLPRELLKRQMQGRINTVEGAPAAPVALVLGAGLRRDGSPTTVLADRIATAVELYRQGKVGGLIMSGATSSRGADEAQAMADLAMRMGVPASALILDREGERTLRSCLHAAQRYGVDRLLVVSQRFHLPRALLLCDAVGLHGHGVEADRRPYRSEPFWKLRESAAIVRALWDARWLRLAGPAA